MPATRPSERLERLFAEFRDAQMRFRPLMATVTQHPGYDDRIDDFSPAGRRREREAFTRLLRKLAAVPAAGLGEPERLSCAAMRWQAGMILERQKAKFYQWGGFFGLGIDPMEGLQSRVPFTIELAQPMGGDSGAKALLARVEAMPGVFRAHVQNLREGLAEGRVATRSPVEKTIAQLETLLAQPVAGTPYLTAVGRLPSRLRGRWEGKVSAAVERRAFPAYRIYLDFLRGEYAGRARPEEKAGLCHVRGGREAYRHLIRFHTTQDIDPRRIHEIGLEELRGIRSEMGAVARRMGRDGGDVRGFLERVRRDPGNFFQTRSEMMRCARGLVKRTYERLPDFFGRLPETPLSVKKFESYKEKNALGAAYLEPPQDLSRPGIYFLNTYQPRTRPRFSMSSLTAHEGVPGHHLQFALAAESRGLPAFRRFADSFSGSAAFIEGWALYSERLADEMGLYRDDLSRVGMLSDQAFRACRLVVDTGLHALGWTRAQAIEFMRENTPMSAESIAPEVDRYTVWPGQALAYKLGQRAISELRRELEGRLGPSFDLKAFHDALLENGALPLPLIREHVARALGS